MVPGAGLEPAKLYSRGILSPLCLPISPSGPKKNFIKAHPGIEPGYTDLQSATYPICQHAYNLIIGKIK